jgi:hypothetical protein
MARQSDAQALKQQALLALDQSRASLSGGLALVRQRLSPRNMLHQGMEKHPVVIAGIAVAAGLAGFLAVRSMMAGRENSRDTFSKPARKRSLGSFLLKGLWVMGRAPLKALAVQQLVPLFARILSEIQSHSKPPPSE